MLTPYRVLDLTDERGELAGFMLAQLGAEVIAVEPPGGTRSRRMTPFAGDGTTSLRHAAYNRGKKSIVLDLEGSAEDRDHLRRLVEGADVLIESSDHGVMEAWGLDHEALLELNPSLVHTSISAFGRSGPKAEWAATDLTAWASAGPLIMTGDADRPPVRVPAGQAFVHAAAEAAGATIAALYERGSSGRGQFVDVGMVDSMMALSEMGMMRYSYMGAHDTPPSGNRSDLIAPFDVFDTKDGQVAIASPTDKHFYILAEAMGHPEWIEAEEGRTLRGRMRNREMIDTALADWCASLTNAQVLDAIGGRVPCGPVNLPGDLFSDPHVTAREMLVAVEQPSGRPIVQVASPIKMTATPTGVHRRAPRLGEHTEEILAELEQAKQRFEA